jgi:hypothetical protein
MAAQSLRATLPSLSSGERHERKPHQEIFAQFYFNKIRKSNENGITVTKKSFYFFWGGGVGEHTQF